MSRRSLFTFLLFIIQTHSGRCTKVRRIRNVGLLPPKYQKQFSCGTFCLRNKVLEEKQLPCSHYVWRGENSGTSWQNRYLAVFLRVLVFRKFQYRTEGTDTWQYNHYIWRGGNSSTDLKEPIRGSVTITFGVEANFTVLFELLILTKPRHFCCSDMVPPILSLAVVILWLSHILGKFISRPVTGQEGAGVRDTYVIPVSGSPGNR